MSTVEFGLMLRLRSDPGQGVQETVAYNKRCLDIISDSFTTLWAEDHLQWETTDVFECLSTLCYLAGAYPQFQLGTMVLSQSYRNPALLAKMMSSLQALSGRRIILGIGAGWKEDEYRAYNYPFPSAKVRVEQLEEAIQVIRAMWTQQSATFEGTHYAVHNAYCAPQPTPTIPILIGGGGEQRTLAVVARHADWWNFNSCPLEEYRRKLTILKQHCERIGRDPDEIILSYLGTVSVAEDPTRVRRVPDKHFIAGNADEVTREIQQFANLGVQHFLFRFLNQETLEHFVNRVVPNFV
jgi:alkanesulfonate monooxygenase SsuD/methylene tetrahydromethanopterin reductase-like flavin-dependent oxidoreductase (luciferase family)